MHNNYFFLIRLVRDLKPKIQGFIFGEIFSQNKDELVIGLYLDEKEFYVKALLSPLFSCLSFPENFHRAKKNSVDLFPDLIGKAIDDIEVFENDRSFRMRSGEFSLVFKLYGNRSNILLFRNHECIDMYKRKFSNDAELTLDDFSKKLDLSYERFLVVEQKTKKFIPTLGPELAEYFEANLDNNAEPVVKWEKLVQFVNEELLASKHPVYVNDDAGLPKLSLFRKDDSPEKFVDAVAAINTFFNRYTREFFLKREKDALLSHYHQRIKKAENYIRSAEGKLYEVENLQRYDQLADIIMANLHQIDPGREEVDLFDFYHDKNIVIKLKKGLTPQKNAENFYRKAKNQKIEIKKIRENIQSKKDELEKYHQITSEIEKARDIKSIKAAKGEKRDTLEKPDEGFHRFSTEGFDIFVGKNARRNDELTFKIANKNDLWLHAKDSPGSHVIIRQIPGRTANERVLEKAAALAAFYSKRNTEKLVPVSYTERKFVRKTKDLFPGQVIVEREKVILVEPVNWAKSV